MKAPAHTLNVLCLLGLAGGLLWNGWGWAQELEPLKLAPLEPQKTEPLKLAPKPDSALDSAVEALPVLPKRVPQAQQPFKWHPAPAKETLKGPLENTSPVTSTVKSSEKSSEQSKNPAPKTASANPIKVLPKVDMLLNGERFRLEVANGLEDQLRGLMFRDYVAPKTGMLFTFSPPRAVNFWMKNCKIALDMVFIRNGRVVHVVEGAPPCVSDPCAVYPSLLSVDTVVELPAGSAHQFVIQPGDRMLLQSTGTNPEPTPAANPQQFGLEPKSLPVTPQPSPPPRNLAVPLKEMQPEAVSPPDVMSPASDAYRHSPRSVYQKP